ncbi:MAG: hypothetical protein V4450_04970 [Bacteroidota bacterium]
MQYDTTKYQVYTWKHPLMLHWIINPGLAINELVFGQRVPRVTLAEKNVKASLAEKTFIPCPHCGTIHSSMKWTSQNKTAFKNWFGLYCDHCEKTIPCLYNLTSLVILGITAPVWLLFRKKWKADWLKVQKEKFAQPLSLTPPSYNWLREGFSFGFFMFIILTLLIPLIDGRPITLKGMLIDLPIWLIAGLVYGLVMKVFLGMKKTEQQPQTSATFRGK